MQLLPRFIRQKLEERSNLRKIIGNTGWLFGEYGLKLVVGSIVGVLLARYLGPEQFGIYNYALAFVVLLEPISSLGLNAIITRNIVRNPEAKEEILGTAFAMRLIGGFLSLIIIVSLNWLLQPDNLLLILFVGLLSIGNLFKAFQVIDFWFQSQVLSKYVVIAKSLTLLISFAIKITLIFVEAPLIAFIAASAIELIFIGVGLVIAYQICGQKILDWRFKFTCGQKLILRSWPLIISGFGAALYLKIDQIMLAQFVTKTDLGIYAVAASISEIWYFIPRAIVSSIFPSLLKTREESPKNYNNKLQKLYDFLFCTSLLITVPVTFAATPLLTVLYGQAYRQAGLILSIHIWASLFIFMRAALSKWLIAEDLLKFSLVTHGLGAIANVTLNLFLIPKLGGIGAAIATVISYAVASYLALFIHPKTYHTARMMTLALTSPIRFLLR